jgi:hypothetical protein
MYSPSFLCTYRERQWFGKAADVPLQVKVVAWKIDSALS